MAGSNTINLLKILIVDDEWLIRSELRKMLNQYRHVQVIGEAGNVAQAIQVVQNSKPDVIFLDIQMPGQTGFDFLDNLDPGCKIVFISAFDQYIEKARQYRPVDYLLKTINKNQLAKVIRKLERICVDF